MKAKYPELLWIGNRPSDKIDVKGAKMTDEEHLKRHIELHKMFDELTADYIKNTDKSLTESSIMDLIHWSFEQTQGDGRQI